MTVPSAPHPAAYDVVMVSFDGVNTAAEAVARVKAADGLQGCEIEGEALISRDAAGQVHLHERGSAALGATFGVVTAGLIGMVTGPLGLLLMVAVGGVAGGIAGHVAGQVIPPEDLRQVGEQLPPGSSAYLTIVDAGHAQGVADAFENEGGRVLNIPVETEFASVVREAITHRVNRV